MLRYIRFLNKPPKYFTSLFIFLAGVLAFAISCRPEFISFDCRFAVFAQEMLRNGTSFFPTTYGEPYPDYPSASTLMIYLASLPFGKVTPFTAILPTVIVSALILVFIYKIGAIHSHQWGLYAVLLALFTTEFYVSSCTVIIDQYNSLATVLSFYIAYSADFYNRRKRVWLIPLLFVFGFVFRGPIGLVIPAGVVCIYYLFNRNYKLFAIMAFSSAILFIVCSLLLLAAAKYQGGESFLKLVITKQVGERIKGDKRHWFGYYLTYSFVSYAIAFPFAAIVTITLFKKIFRRESSNDKLLSYLIIWIIVVLIGMTIPGSKKIRYVLPMIPAVALVASYIFIDTSQNNIFLFVKNLFLQFCKWFPAGTAIFALGAWILSNWFLALSGASYLIIIIVLLLMAFTSWFLYLKLKESDLRNLLIIASGTATFIIIYAGINVPLTYKHEITTPFVRKVETVQARLSDDIVFYKIRADAQAIKFMANLDKPLIPKFISKAEDIIKFKTSACFIAFKKDFELLPKDIAQSIRILDNGKISNDDCVVFTRLSLD